MKNQKREICTSGSVRDEDGQPPHLLGRRQFLRLAAGAAALPAVSRIARAQAYPARPVRIIVGYPPGGATDAMARLVAHQLPERLGQQFIVDNRPGPGGNIGTEAVMRSQPDGYTLLLIFSANAINATFYDKLSFNFIRDIAPIASIARSPFVMEVHPSVPAKTVPEFVAYAKANPGKIRMASNGNGTTAHVAGELFKLMTGVDMVHVPYRGPEPALTDLLAGKVQVRFGIPSESIEYIKAGKLPEARKSSQGVGTNAMAKLEPPTDACATTWLPPVSSHLASAGAGPERYAAVVKPPGRGKREIQKLLHVPSPKTRRNLILAKGGTPDLWV